MTETVSVNLVKPEWVSKKSTFSAVNAKIKQLALGGGEGKKFQLDVADPRGEKDSEKLPLTFITKELTSSRTPQELEKLAKVHRILFSRGYPVPATARYFELDGKRHLAMSDMTEGGKYWLWGFSNQMTFEQSEELAAMNLSRRDLRKIRSKLSKLVKKAYSDRFLIEWFSYHVRKNKETGEVDVVILDLYPSHGYFKRREQPLSSNYKTQDEKFMARLKEAMADIEQRKKEAQKIMAQRS